MSLTKDELKSALSAAGVDLPPSSTRKSELASLYEAHVGPLEAAAAAGEPEFSSDDEAEPESPPDLNGGGDGGECVLTEETSLIAGELNVAQLNDDQLLEKLKQFGVDAAIVDSTRAVYQKKLAILLRSGAAVVVAVDAADAGDDNAGANGAAELDYSADEEALTLEEPAVELSVVDAGVGEPAVLETGVAEPAVLEPGELRRSARTTSLTTSASKRASNSPASHKRSADVASDLRKRFQRASGADGDADPEITFGERFTPTPRRSIHSYKVVESTKTTMVKSADGSISHDVLHKKATREGLSKPPAAKAGGACVSILRLLPKIFLLLIVASVAVYVYNRYVDSVEGSVATGGGPAAAAAAAAPVAADAPAA